MASARKSENQSRIAATNNARDAILEHVEKDSARMMMGFLANPGLAGKLQNFGQIVEILLNKGFTNDLRMLSQDKRAGDDARSLLRRTLAEAEFRSLCQAPEASASC